MKSLNKQSKQLGITTLLLVTLLVMGFPINAKADTCADCLKTNKSVYQSGEEFSFEYTKGPANASTSISLFGNGWKMFDRVPGPDTDNAGSVPKSSSIGSDIEEGDFELLFNVGTSESSVKFKILPTSTPLTTKSISKHITDYSATLFFSAIVGTGANGVTASQALKATTSKPVYQIGETPEFKLSGGKPGSEILGLTFVNNNSYLFYGPKLDANGSFQGSFRTKAFSAYDEGNYVFLFAAKDSGVAPIKLTVGNPEFTGKSTVQNEQSFQGSAVLKYRVSLDITRSTSPNITVTGLPKGMKVSNANETDADGSTTKPTVWRLLNPQVTNQKVEFVIEGAPEESVESIEVWYDDGQKLKGFIGVPISIQKTTSGSSEDSGANLNQSGGFNYTYPDSSTGLFNINDVNQGNDAPGYGQLMQGQYAWRHIKNDLNNTVYFVNASGYKIAVPSEKIFLSYGNSWSNVVTVSDEELNQFPETSYIRLKGDARVYMVTNNTKKYITPAVATERQIPPDMVIEVNKTEFNFYKTVK